MIEADVFDIDLIDLAGVYVVGLWWTVGQLAAVLIYSVTERNQGTMVERDCWCWHQICTINGIV